MTSHSTPNFKGSSPPITYLETGVKMENSALIFWSREQVVSKVGLCWVQRMGQIILKFLARNLHFRFFYYFTYNFLCIFIPPEHFTLFFVIYFQLFKSQSLFMKEQDQIAADNINHQPKINEHPALYYSTSQIYSIRKESINNSNDLIYKKLSKQFQRIKKLRADSNGNNILSLQYDYDNSSIKRDFRRLHDSYNLTTKANVIVKRRIDKMRNKVDHIKSEVQKDQLNSVREVDINKILSKGAQSSSISNGPSTTAKSKI